MSADHWEEAVRVASSSVTALTDHSCLGPHKASEGVGESCLWSCDIRLCFFYLNSISTHVSLGGNLSLPHELVYSSLKVISEYPNLSKHHCYQNVFVKWNIIRKPLLATPINKFQDAFYKIESILTVRVWSFPIPETSSLEWWVNDLYSGRNFWLWLFFANQASKDTGTGLKLIAFKLLRF